MKKHDKKLAKQCIKQWILLAVGVTFHVGVMAESLSKDQYEQQTKRVEANYESAKDQCSALKDNAQDICMAKAKGRNSIAKALLKAHFEPTLEHQVDARIVTAEANYAIAIAICGSSTIKNKASCTNQAQILKDQSIANARAMAKTTRLERNQNGLLMSLNQRKNPSKDQYIYAKPLPAQSAKRIFV